RVIHTPSVSAIDGIDLRPYRAGLEYEVGTTVGSLLLLNGWAEPVVDGKPPPRVQRSAGGRSNPSRRRSGASAPTYTKYFPSTVKIRSGSRTRCSMSP